MDDDVFDGGPSPLVERIVFLGLPLAWFIAICWRIGTEVLRDGRLHGAQVGGLLFVTTCSVFFATPAAWLERHRVRRLVLTPDGCHGITSGGRGFDLSWRDIRETSVEFRMRISKSDWIRSVRLDTTIGPLLVTDALPRFDALVARIHAATPHAFQHALPTRFERWMLRAKRPATPPAAPDSGSASA